MPRWRELRRRIGALDEIGQILGAVRSLAFTELRQLADGEPRQHATAAAIQTAIEDLAAHFPDALPERAPDADILIVLGSERGFCGDFNEVAARAAVATRPMPAARRLAVGAKLCQLLEEQGVPHSALPGPTVVEEIPRALAGIVDAIEAVARSDGDAALGLVVAHHDGEGRLESRRILPFPALPVAARWRTAPDLQIAPRRLYRQLIDHHVLAALNLALIASLLAENRRRLEQLSGALDRLHERLEGLRHARRRARQEAITEEIEVILLGASAVP